MINIYIPKKNVDNLVFILEMFIETHGDSDVNVDDVNVAKLLLKEIRGSL